MTRAQADLFPGFEEHTIDTGQAEIFLRRGGNGPALVLLHGYPQTHACWHRLASSLAATHTVVLPDLRGYGRSRGPQDDTANNAYDKRSMAGDIVETMRQLGYNRFALAGHDRGARVAYRLALDTPRAVERLILLDILPTAETWEAMRAESAISAYHWPFLAQPAPLPETLIAAAPHDYVDHTLASWSRTRDLSPFNATALGEYRNVLATPAGRHAACQDYRAGASLDWQADASDREHGRRVQAPTLVLWGDDYVGKSSTQNPLDIWRRWADDVRGHGIPAGHFLAEEAPQETLAAVQTFLAGC